MSCDVSHVFHTLVRVIQTTDETTSSGTTTTTPRLVRPSKTSNAYSFWNRAASLRGNLQMLADYVKRVQQLTATSVGNTFKQRAHAELTNQVTALIDQCTALLIQLKEVSRLDDNGQKLTSKQQQLRQYRQVIYESLEEELNKLKRLRDIETDRQRHLMELTGSLASGVRSISPSRLRLDEIKQPDSTTNTDSLLTRRHGKSPDIEIRNRRKPAQPHMESLVTPAVEEPNLTDAELQAFELENRLMYNHLSGQREDITQVARAISEIGRLNQTLSMHLTDQLEATQQIGASLTLATEDVCQGNEQLRSTLSNKASMQFWILFVLIVLTFSLHFLDWYYP